MPDITLIPVPTDGYMSSAPAVMTQLYYPSSSPMSLEVQNGWLDNDNMKSTWSVKREHIRPGSCSGAKMVGLTGNLDYLQSIATPNNHSVGAYIPIPGASLSFQLPFNATLVLFTWQMVITNDSPYLSSVSANATELQMYIDGVSKKAQSRAVPDSTDNSPGSAAPPDVYDRQKKRERIWSGHHMMSLTDGTSLLDAGWHSAYIGIFNVAPAARVRIRNFKCMYWR